MVESGHLKSFLIFTHIVVLQLLLYYYWLRHLKEASLLILLLYFVTGSVSYGIRPINLSSFFCFIEVICPFPLLCPICRRPSITKLLMISGSYNCSRRDTKVQLRDHAQIVIKASIALL